MMFRFFCSPILLARQLQLDLNKTLYLKFSGYSLSWLTVYSLFFLLFFNLVEFTVKMKISGSNRSYSRRQRTPTLLQMEATECGAAALGIILAYYGRIVPLAELRQVCGVSRDGIKASSILSAALNYGLTAKGFKIYRLDILQEEKCPYIVFWNLDHYLVVEGFNQKRVYLNDPATGPRSVSWQEFDEGFTGVVLCFEPNSEFSQGGRKPNIILSLWERLRGALGALIYCLAAGLLLTLVNLVVPVFSQVLIDEIWVQDRQDWLRPLLLGMAIAVVFQGGLTLLRLRYLRRLKVKLAVVFSSHFLWHLLRLPVSFYAQRYAAEIAYRTRLNDQVAEVLSGQLATTAIDAVMVIFYALVLSQYDLVLTVVVISLAAVNVLAMILIARRRVDTNQRLINEYGKAEAISMAGLQNIETFKASGTESDFFTRWVGCYSKAIDSQQELEITNQIFGILPIFLSALSSAFLLLVGGIRVMDGYLSIGMLVAFQGMMQGFQKPIDNLVYFSSTLQELEGNIIRLDDVLDNSVEQNQKLKKPSLEFGQSAPSQVSIRSERQYYKLQGHVEIRNLTFGYSPLEAPSIQNFNLTVEPGYRVAIVGASGSGKSTVAKLVSGLYQPWSGKILFDGKPREEIPDEILTHSIAMVDQDFMMFGGTVKENLSLWDSSIRESNLIRACQDAAIASVIQSLTGGFEAQLLEGAVNLSGGQRQRLEIARALVNNPSVLILDEATSALDAETEATVNRHLRQRGCTCIIVAHRLSTIRNCDQIIVIERGQVVQQGTHEDMWQTDGVYLRLIKNLAEAV
jgi:ATP-binding cassette subfamily C protein